jgi:hypothetical protein
MNRQAVYLESLVTHRMGKNLSDMLDARGNADAYLEMMRVVDVVQHVTVLMCWTS